MPSYQYITKGGQAATFDAADDNAALSVLNTKADRDPSTGFRAISAPTAAPTAPSTTPGVTPPIDYTKTAETAGAAGLGMNDYSALLGATPEEQKAAKDEIAKQFGYDSSDAFLTEAFSKPSQTTEQ